MSLHNSESLLNDVSLKLGAIRQAKRMFAEQLAPEFSFFDYFRADEMALSACIAGLLDPNGTHGQGNVFLQAFFTHMVPKKDLVSNFKVCDVKTEHQTNNQRRIDIVLRFDDVIVGIENKPWAGETPEQLSAYAIYLETEAKRMGKKWLLIYLCDRDPLSLCKSLREHHEKQGTFIQCSFAQLGVWLEECSTKAKALQVRIFIEELQKFVRMRVKGELDMNEEKETTGVILASQRNLIAAFDVFKALEATKVQLLEQLKDDLSTQLKVKGYELDWVDSFSQNLMAYAGFGIKFHPNQDIYLRFEFEKSDRRGLLWGFKRNDNVTYQVDRWKTINHCMQSFGEGGNPEKEIYWPWWSADSTHIFGENLRDWYQNVRPWSLLLSQPSDGQSIASRITHLATEVHAAMKDHPSILIANAKLVASA